MTEDDVEDVSDYRKKNDTAGTNGNTVSSKNPPARLSEKLRNAISSGLRTQMYQQMRNRHGL